MVTIILHFRQRNKALDDLQYYSTENLNPVQDEDYKVREYLDKLSNNNHRDPPISRSVTPNTLISTDQSIHHDQNEMTAFKTRDQYMAKSVDQINYHYQNVQHNGRMTKSSDNIIENYNTSYPTPAAATELNEQHIQRPVTPISTLESEPNGRMFSSYMMKEPDIHPLGNNINASQPVPAVRSSKSTATIISRSSTAGLLHTDL